ncbi:MAG: L-histidine N(alpha)-methyltransferase [Syntrophorhabdus sp.]
MAVTRLHTDLSFADDVKQGLLRKPRAVSCKYLYDDTGSRIFKEIMNLEEYYPTGCELEIMEMYKDNVAGFLGKGEFNLIELGAGDGLKTRVLIGHFLDRGLKFRYVPIDISESALNELETDIGSDFPGLPVSPVADDYLAGLKSIATLDRHRNIVLFLGSTIGNFDPFLRDIFLARLKECMNDGDFFLIGFDLKKDAGVLTRAYNDSRGVTARFNFNLLHRINRDLKANFDPGKFCYYSTYNPLSGAVESFLISQGRQEVSIAACAKNFVFESWDSIHTESSYKFQDHAITSLAQSHGFEVLAQFYDRRHYFTDSLWRVRK